MGSTNLEEKKNRSLEKRCTRSNDGLLLATVKSKCSAYDRRVANISGNTWNQLPVSTRNAENIAGFKKLLRITATSKP